MTPIDRVIAVLILCVFWFVVGFAIGRHAK